MKTVLSRLALRVLGSLTLSHLAMVHVERYIAIKHSLQYETIVTEDRLVCLSALLWIILLPLIVPFSFLGDKIISIIVDVIIISLFIATVFVCQVQARIHTGFHRFTENGQILHNRYIFNKEKTFQVARLFPRRMELANILNELETPERGHWGVKIWKLSRGSMAPDPTFPPPSPPPPSVLV